MLSCYLCSKVALNGEAFYPLSYKHIDMDEYNARLIDGRSTDHSTQTCCEECFTELNEGRPPLKLADIKEMRKRNLTEEEYYKLKNY